VTNKPFEKSLTMADQKKRPLPPDSPSTSLLAANQKKADAKLTPDKQKMEERDPVPTDLPLIEDSKSLFGQPNWCAACDLCIDEKVASNHDYVCTNCRIFTHRSCMVPLDDDNASDEDALICLKCKEDKIIRMHDETSMIEQHETHYMEVSSNITQDLNDTFTSENTV
jgi:hypothetical protein